MDDAKQFEIFYDEAVRNKKIKKLVIDLRENGGGDSDVLSKMLSVLTEKGMELYSIDQKDPALRQTHISDGKYLGAGKKFAGQLFVITNGNTASSADIMTGVIKNIGGIQVGEPTYGKGIGQSGYIVHNGYMLWVTALLVDLPNYGYYHGIPFEPDVPVSAMEQAFTADEFLPLEDTVTPITPDSDPERIKAYQQRILLYGPDMLIPSGVLDKRTFWFTNAILATSGTEPLAGDMDNYHVDTETLKFLAGGIDEKNFMNILTKTETDEALQYCLDYNVSKKAA
jgi:carboxyl-terminal processing protease